MRVLAELVKDASRTESVMAKAAKVSRSTFRSKRAALEKTGVIRGYLPYISNRAFRVSNGLMLAKFSKSRAEDRTWAMRSIAERNPKSLSRTRGDWDVIAIFPFRHSIEAGQSWKQLTVNMPFTETNFELCGKLLQPERLPLEQNTEILLPRPSFHRNIRKELSREDVALIEDVADFPNDSIVSRLKRLGGSGEAWRQRLVKLRAGGVLRGPCAWVDLRRLGYFRVHALAAINPYTHDFEERFTALIEDIPQVSYAEALNGTYSLRLSLMVKIPDDLFGCLARLDGFWGQKCMRLSLMWEEYEMVRRSVPRFGVAKT